MVALSEQGSAANPPPAIIARLHPGLESAYDVANRDGFLIRGSLSFTQETEPQAR